MDGYWDQQSLANALSTFSGHMNNIAQIVKHASRQSIVLLDEIGSGTEPNEGAALAIAIMEAIYHSGALLIATTHYGKSNSLLLIIKISIRLQWLLIQKH